MTLSVRMEGTEQPARALSPISGTPVPPPRWKKGESGNPGGLPKGFRKVTVAYRELDDTPGKSLAAIIAAFKAKRGVELCGADHRAIAMFKSAWNEESRNQVTAAKEITDRTEGTVAQNIVAESRSFVVEVPVRLEDAATWMERFAPADALPEAEAEASEP